MKRVLSLTLGLVLLGAAMACGGSSNNAVVTAPTGTLVTETFNGTVQVGGLSSNPFTVTVGGTVNITLIAAGPPATITMGLGVGTPSGATCALLSGGSTTTVPGTAAQLSGPLAAGSYCVEVIDIGNAAVPIAYTVTVAHT
jgi:hypothetical protein